MTRNEYYRRGFNQAQKLAKAISKLSGIPIMKKSLKKIKKTEEQKKLNSSARLENIRGAFSVSPNTILKEKSVLLVDDVCTTGATLSEAASVLLKNGAEKVIAIVFAKTVKNSDKFS
jgi:ComF family protein